MAKFKIGDSVICIKSYEGNNDIANKIGRIIDVSTGGNLIYGVEFYNYIGGHSCDSRGANGYCWWIPEKCLIPFNGRYVQLNNIISNIDNFLDEI